ncbi:type 1 glutamine amidotransferase domain-containing protein, partial [Tetragenococcus koreensis]
LVFVDYYSTGELTCFLFSETKKDASDFSPTSYIIEPVNADDYCGIYYTGGHGVMWDFPNNSALEKISLQIYQNNGYVMSVCHGIAGLLFIKDENGQYFVKDKKITGFTTTEEYLSGKSSVVPFFNEKIAEKHGAQFVKKRAFKSFAVQDGLIITGQNPFSARSVAQKFLENV